MCRSSFVLFTCNLFLAPSTNLNDIFNSFLGDLESIGKTMDTCWEHKKLMAPGCEPEICRIIMDSVRPVSYGM